jgi:hypothetical protein
MLKKTSQTPYECSAEKRKEMSNGELERQKARDDNLACPITTALMASSGVNRDHE